MTKIKVSSLQPGPQMNALVAEARGWIKCNPYGTMDDAWCMPAGEIIIYESDYNPSTNGGQCFELIEEFDCIVGFHPLDHRLKSCTAMNPITGVVRVAFDKDRKIAICRAVIAAHFGDKVEVEE